MPFYQSADFTSEWIAPSDPRYAGLHKVAPFALVDQEGRVVSNASLRGKVYAATFFFSHCTSLCPKMLTNLRKLQRRFEGEPGFAIVSHSVMPNVDSSDVLRRFGQKNGVNPRSWHLVTGDHEAIYTLARRSYFAEKRQGLAKKNDELLHTENLVLVDGEGRLRGVYNATLPAEIDRAAEDIAALLAGR